MLKFLYMGDIHEHVEAPTSRIDNFEETKQRKIAEILKIAKDNNVSAILEPGDFLEKPKYSFEFISKVINRWAPIKINELAMDLVTGHKTPSDIAKILKDSVIPIIGTIGNHELFGGQISSLEKTSINLLRECGLITFVSKDEPIIFKDEEGFSVAITASPYTHNIDGDDKSAYIIEKKNTDFHIHLAHGLLMPKSYGKKFKHTVVSEIADKTAADLTINGHDHIGYMPIEINGKIFVNPGSPFRLSNDKKEMSRKPKVLLIEVTKAGIKIKQIYLKSAEDGEKVLSREKIEKAQEKNLKLANVQSMLNKASKTGGIDIVEIIKSIAAMDGVDSKTITSLIEKINEKISKLSDPITPAEDYYIKKLTLENYSSHKHSEFEFSKGKNILAGPSGSGKSGVLRAISELFDAHSRNPRNSIFFNENYFRITAELSNGYVISRYVESKESGKNGFEIYDPHTGDTSWYNTKGLPIVQQILGYHKIKLSDKDSIDVNFQVQGDSWFFIGNNTTAPDNGKLMGIMYGTNYSDAVLKDIDADIRKAVIKLNQTNEDIEKLNEEKKEYLYISELDKDVTSAESLLVEIKELEEKKKKIDSVLNKRNALEIELKKMGELINKLTANSNNVEILFNQLKIDNNNIIQIDKKINDMDRVLLEGKKAAEVLAQLKNIKKSETLLNDIKESKEQYLVLAEKYKKYSILNIRQSKENKAIERATQVIDSLKSLSAAQLLVEDLKEKAETINKVSELIANINKITVDGAKESEIIKKMKTQKIENLQVYKEELSTLGKCPICHGTIDKAVINNIIAEYE